MDLYYKSGAKIKITFADGQILIGIVDHWTPEGDSEDNIQELAIIPTEGDLKGRLVGFSELEVEKIEVLS